MKNAVATPARERSQEEPMTEPATRRTSTPRPSTTRTNMSTSRELLSFIWNGKTWWLTPVVVVLIMLSFLVVFLETSALAPFIYALF
jgi:Family of unknown function (DUF5989)